MTLFKANGLYYAQPSEGGDYVVATSLERLLEKLDPGAPPEKVRAAAEILEPFIGKGKEQFTQGVETA